MIELYLISVLGTLKIIVGILAVLSGLGFIIGGLTKQIFDPEKDSDDYRASCNVFKVSTPMFLICTILTVFIPTKSQLYMILGVGPIIDNIQNSEVAKQLPDKTLQVLNKWCDDYLDTSHEQNNN